MICAIHQPNFFPWLGYFNKIYKADVFIFLDQVDYPKSSKTMSTWSNRVAVSINGEKHWISCPVVREEGKQKICNVQIDESVDWRKKLIKTLEYNYKKSGFYDEVSDFIFSLIMNREETLAEFNIRNIRELCKKLGINSQFYRQSELETTKSATELLIEIAKAVNCDTYMCGGGAGGYQEDGLFEKSGLELKYQNYNAPYYEQKNGQCIQGLSILDALFNCGFIKAKQLIEKD